MTRWTWGWLSGLAVLVALGLTVPAYGQGGSETGDADDSTVSFFGLVHRAGDSEDVLTAYKLGMVLCLLVVAAFVLLDLRARRARRRASTSEVQPDPR